MLSACTDLRLFIDYVIGFLGTILAVLVLGHDFPTGQMILAWTVFVLVTIRAALIVASWVIARWAVRAR